jgi:hypothetical protein
MLRSPQETGRELVAAIAAQDWRRLEGTFAPGVLLRALIPPGLREREGAAEAAELIGGWFGDADPLELVDSEVEELEDRLHIAYRFRAFEEGRDHLVEQHVFCVMGAEGIESAHLVCSGFRPLA